MSPMQKVHRAAGVRGAARNDGARTGRRPLRWLPDQHGAWAMLLLPFAAGVWLAGPAAAHLPLLVAWVSGYLAVIPFGRWLRARRRRDLLPPVVAFGATAALGGVVAVALAPRLLAWALLYAPLLAASLALAATGRERSLANDAISALAATAIAGVVFDAGGGGDWTALATTAGVLLAYFLGTVLYVKTMIRERGRPGYVAASVGYHVAAAAAGSGLAVLWGWGPAVPVLAWLLAVRAWAGPRANARRSRPLRPAVVGIGEIAASLALTIAVLAAVGG